MKKLFWTLLVLLQSVVLYADNAVKVTISDGLSNDALKNKMEQNLGRLLTEVNEAQSSGRAIDLGKMSLSDDVKLSLEMLWENSPFVCDEEEIIEHCLTTNSGYQIRNIPLMMKPLPGSDAEEDYQEAVVSFNKQGEITSFYIAIDMNLYMNVLKAKNGDLIDLRRRELILDYVEQFRTSYNQKDIKFLDQVFSDDALVITGKVIQQKSREGIKLPDKIEYKKQSKQEYLTNLKRVFANNKQIRVTFDEIEVLRHPSNADYYGVTLHQGYSSDRYHDDGYVFLLWDFKNEDAPEIHVRTWQPDAYNADGKGKKPIPKDEIFSLSDFDI